jgi:pimeloyl-ACP methyl ester carboxylesterase
MTTITRGLAPTRFGQLHYRTAGAGTPLLLISINQQSSAMYLELIEAVAGFCRPIAVDYPSHGMSDHVAEQPTIADYAGGMIDVLDHLGIESGAVLGEATGAAVAIELAASHPDRVERIVLVNCPWVEALPRTHDFVAEFAAYRPADETGFPLTRTIEFMLAANPPSRRCIPPRTGWTASTAPRSSAAATAGRPCRRSRCTTCARRCRGSPAPRCS